MRKKLKNFCASKVQLILLNIQIEINTVKITPRNTKLQKIDVNSH